MSGSETVKLDPTAVATSRTELDITQYVAVDGVDWGNATIEQYLAERGGYGGALPIDYRVPNRQITMPLKLQTRGTVTFDQIRAKLQSKTALLQSEGGWLGRVTSKGGTVFADVVNASLKFGGGWGQARGRYDENAELTLECLPDWYGAEVTLSSHSGTTLPELTFTETGITGDYPNRVRVVVTDTEGKDQLGLIWGFRSRHYSSASTAALGYEAEALTPMDTAAIATLSGASGGASNNSIAHTSVSTNWTPVLNTNLLAGTYLTHVGSYRVWARVYRSSGVDLRFVYDVGDMTNPTENDPWSFPGSANQFFLADLGEIRLDETTGTHRWQGQIQAKGDVGGESVWIDRLFFQPLDESAGRLRAPLSANPGLASYTARDEFNQSTGALGTKTATVGGNWAGAGDADDYQVTTGGDLQILRRTATSDATDTGRYAVVGSSITNTVVQVDIRASSASGAARLGVLARYTDVNNWVMAWITLSSPPAVFMYKRVAGTITQINNVATGISFTANTWYTIRLMATASGQVAVWYFAQGANAGDPVVTGYDSALATGGSLASGKAGIYDANETATANTRDYDHFAAWVPPGDAVAFANQSVELRTDGMFREDSGGVAYGPVSQVIGDLPRLPVAGLEGRTTGCFIKASRGDLDLLPDAGVDDISAQIFYRPTFLFVPD